MSNSGALSIELMVTNDTRGNLTISAASTGSGDSWMSGMNPTVGSALNQYTAAPWGVMTTNPAGVASGYVQLTGLGSFPVTVSFQVNAAGVATCTVAPNNAIKGITQQIMTGEQNHAMFQVQLIP